MTGPLRLQPEAWITFEDEAHKITGLKGSHVRLRSESGEPQLILAAELMAHPSFAPRHPDETPPSPTPASEGNASAFFDDLPAEEIKRITALEGDLLEVLTGYRSGDEARPAPGEPRPAYDPASELALEARIEAKAHELGITARSLFGQLRKWREAGLWGLADKRKARARHGLAGIDPRIATAVREQAAFEVDDSTGSLPRFRRRVEKRLEARYGPGAVPLSSDSTFRRQVALLTGGRYTFGPATTRRTNNNRPQRMFGHVFAARPGEVVMLDTTRLDVIAYDPEHDTTLPVELTICLDLFTRSILSWRITPEGTKGIEIGMLVADSMMPEPMRPAWKEAMRFSMDKIPYARLAEFDERLALAAARPVIYPESIMIDHGKPYQSEVLRRGCGMLGINILPSREGKPTDKPEVEAAFDTIRRQFSEHVAGYKGSGVAQRGRNVEAMARWTISELEEFFAEYVVTVYQRKRHTGLTIPGYPGEHLSPNDAYALGVEIAGYVACPSDPALYYELLPIVWASIRAGGVQHDYLVYDAAVLGPYRGLASHYKNPRKPSTSGRWPIRFDSRNMLHAYFYDELADEPRWHVLTWTHALDTHLPFTDVMLRHVKKVLAERGIRPDDQVEIAATLRDLQNRTDAPESWTTTDRRRAAKDAANARAASRDRGHAVRVAAHTPAVTLRAVPNPEPEPVPAPRAARVLDLSKLKAAEVWRPETDGETG